jgi:hypothetical protein
MFSRDHFDAFESVVKTTKEKPSTCPHWHSRGGLYNLQINVLEIRINKRKKFLSFCKAQTFFSRLGVYHQDNKK